MRFKTFMMLLVLIFLGDFVDSTSGIYDTAGNRKSLSNVSTAQCVSDGSFRLCPKSYAENDWIIELVGLSSHICIGIHDIDSEGNFVISDGRPLSYTRWVSNQSDKYANNEDAVHIIGYGTQLGGYGYWNDLPVTPANKFVCMLGVTGEFILLDNHLKYSVCFTEYDSCSCAIFRTFK